MSIFSSLLKVSNLKIVYTIVNFEKQGELKKHSKKRSALILSTHLYKIAKKSFQTFSCKKVILKSDNLDAAKSGLYIFNLVRDTLVSINYNSNLT